MLQTEIELGLVIKTATLLLLSILGFLIKKYLDRLESNDQELRDRVEKNNLLINERVSKIEECYRDKLEEIKNVQIKILERIMRLETLHEQKK